MADELDHKDHAMGAGVLLEAADELGYDDPRLPTLAALAQAEALLALYGLIAERSPRQVKSVTTTFGQPARR